jgi:hypothetical protein
MMSSKDVRHLTGDIIEESLQDRSVLSQVTILDTRVEPVTLQHQTPWIERWTIHRIAVPQQRAAEVAKCLSEALDAEHAHAWYADIKNEAVHYVIFLHKVFRVSRDSEEQYAEVVDYGTKLGIPLYQLDFSPTVERWQG